MSVRRAVERHRAGLGASVAVYRSRPGAGTYLAALVLWLLMVAGVLINPDPELVHNVVPLVVWGSILAGILAMLGGEVLIVCERGLLVGSTAPLLRPRPVPYDRIVPGTVVPVLRPWRLTATTGLFWPRPTTRTAWWNRSAVSFVQAMPWPLWWFVGTGRADPGQVSAEIAAAARRAGFTDLAEATVAAPRRTLTGRREDAALLLPGFPGAPGTG
ncbi:hypothetical protein LQF12_09525 [Ruania suaedae]|uniref:hypothetical protein n=1 Tax=Ruania suaedae TaxID=2897774 RepID=UPI001E2D9EAF|nr:hypothetical protein [Ruania suaedae]UFU01760.1 hypothetical protein LQF12_09525 [Ruania suaedae]